jgi:8-oxo-dGTP diphosphatase
MRDNRILLGKRRNTHGEGCWSFPGGHLEYGESIEACAHREVMEETGLVLANLRLGPYTNDIFEEENKHYVTLFVLADCRSGQATVREPERCEAWGWFEWSCLPQPLFMPIVNLRRQGFRPPFAEVS